MADVQEKLKFKKSNESWTIREQLCLASSVLKTGEQNWMNISCIIRQIADENSERSIDSYSQKSCAQQYSYLLEKIDVQKKKKKEGDETIKILVERLTEERIKELTKILADQQEEYYQLRNEVNLLKNGTVSDEKLQKMWLAIEDEEKEKIKKFQKVSINKNQQIINVQPLNVLCTPKKTIESTNEETKTTQVNSEDSEKKDNKDTKSSLLTSLLKSPSHSNQTQTLPTTSPTISSLLGSSPKVSGSVVLKNISQSQQINSNMVNLAQDRPLANTPTLSMLLEQPSTENQKVLQQQLQNSSLSNTSNLQNSPQSQTNTIQTRSSRQSAQISQVPIVPEKELKNKESSQVVSDPVEEDLSKVMQIDEINEIIGDIEELINEEITEDQNTLDSSVKTLETTSKITDDQIIIADKTKITVEPTSLSNSPNSEIYVEEIDSSASNIEKIIGTAIETSELKTSTTESTNKTKDTQLSKPIADKKVTKPSDCPKEKPDNTETTETKNFESKNITENKIITNKEIVSQVDKPIIDQEKNQQEIKKKEKKIIDDKANLAKETSKSVTITKKICKETVNPPLDNKDNKIVKPEKIQQSQRQEKSSKEKIVCKEEEKKKVEKSKPLKKNEETESSVSAQVDVSKKECEKANEIKKLETKQDLNQTKQNPNDSKNENKEATESTKISEKKDKKKQSSDNPTVEDDKKNRKTSDSNKLEVDKVTIKSEIDSTKEKVNGGKKKELKKDEKLNDCEKKDQIKIEPKNEEYEYQNEEINNEEKLTNDSVSFIKKEIIEATGSGEEIDEEEPILNKLSANKAMKTYSKKQNTSIDSETENETSGETADYKSWKKLIMSVHNTLATHKYASIFLRPITDDQAPGYHSIIFRPMDLSTIKKNIDNGTIRTTTHFQRDVMLMFQNAIMFNKHNTFVHKMTLEMRDECLQHMQIFVQAAGEASSRDHNRRETRTAASITNDTAESSSSKRKWSAVASSPHDTESPRLKKRRKSEND